MSKGDNKANKHNCKNKEQIVKIKTTKNIVETKEEKQNKIIINSKENSKNDIENRFLSEATSPDNQVVDTEKLSEIDEADAVLSKFAENKFDMEKKENMLGFSSITLMVSK